MTVCSDVKGCLHLQANALRLDVSISWPTSAAEDLRARHTVGVRSGDCGFSPPPSLLLSSTLPLGHMDAVSGVNMLPQLQDVALTGGGGGGAALIPAGSSTTTNNTSVSSSPTQGADNRGCENGALMDSFGIFLQGLLAMVAFSTLMCECLLSGCFFFLFSSVSDIWLQLLGGTRSLSNRVPRLISCVIDRWHGWVTGKGKPLWYTHSTTFCRGF